MPSKGAPPMPSKGPSAPPSAKGPAGTPVKLAAPPGKMPLKAPGLKGPPGAKLPMKAPPPAAAGGNDAGDAASEASDGPAAPPAKAPMKAPLKLPLKAPGKAPLKLLMKKVPTPGPSSAAPSEPGDDDQRDAASEPPLTARTDMGGTREDDPLSPVATPRDMPQPSAQPLDAASPAAASPDGGSIPPPPSVPPSAPTSPRPPDAATSPAAETGTSAAQPPGGNALASPAVGPPPAAPATVSVVEALMGGEWPVHTSAPSGGSGSDGAASHRVQLSEQYESQIRSLQQRGIESEQYIASLTNEVSRLRETLYEREGVKVVQHIAELEKENRKLRLQLEKERESRLYHQSAHLSIMDELILLRQTSDAGDVAKMRIDNERLQLEVSKLVQANTMLSLKFADVSSKQDLAAEQADAVDLASSTHLFVNVRRGALCRSCQDLITRMEHAQVRRAMDGGPATGSFSPDQPTTISLLSTHRAAARPYPPSSPAGLEGEATIKSPALVAGGWSALAVPGSAKVVYHNAVTNRSQWDMPPEVAAAASPAANPPGGGAGRTGHFASVYGSTAPYGSGQHP